MAVPLFTTKRLFPVVKASLCVAVWKSEFSASFWNLTHRLRRFRFQIHLETGHFPSEKPNLSAPIHSI
jgi:hypothetical protein